ncbi:hypothetical protein [Anaeromyxobacter diazotrophicus]|uniref:DUF3352 domain-containing protein n=1 Tax=Anaeromyxobacter diazotrophicus TaxID=2590199 RepID=A0A7I9VKT6_9BACT|nr:hypothetical protein [Anaeromyxobacter diazotrophicus]GEJ56750.1 hypothetical protein AMYX_14910 [Anaeromyxobacter diazotrophicus]
MRNRPALAALLLLAASGCGRCGGPAAAPPERLLPADVPLVVVVPRLRAAQEQAVALLRTVLTFPAAADLADALAAAKAQLGLDPLDPLALAAAGLDPERGLAAARTATGELVLVLPVADAAKLADTVGRLAQDRLGAGRREPTRAGGFEVTAFRAAGQPVALALLVAGGHALLAAGPGAPDRLAALAAAARSAPLERSAPFARARAALGGERTALLFAPPGSPAVARWPALREGAAAALSAAATRLQVDAVLLLGQERRQLWGAALAPPSGAAAVELPGRPPDAFLAGRLAGDPAPLLRRALWAAPGVQAALARAGLDPERDLLGLLAPGATAALALAPTFDVAAVSRGAEGAVTGDPFRLAHLTAALAVQDEARARAALARLAAAAPALGFTAAARGPGGAGWRFARGPLALDVALDGRRLLVAGGPGRLEQLLGGGARGDAAPTADARRALAPGASGAVIDFGQLVAAFRALPAAAYGSGPDAFVMRSLADRLVDPAARLLAASARAEVTAEAARLELVVEARPPEAAP